MQLPSSFCQNVDVPCWIWWVNAAAFSSSCLEWMRKGGRGALDFGPYAGCPLGWSTSWFLCSFSSIYSWSCRYTQLYLSYRRLQTWASKSWSKAAVSPGWGGGQGLWWLRAGPAPTHAGRCPPDWGCTSVTAPSILKGSITAFLWIWSRGLNAGAQRGMGTAFVCGGPVLVMLVNSLPLLLAFYRKQPVCLYTLP